MDRAARAGLVERGQSALAAGRWAEARDVFELVVAEDETGPALGNGGAGLGDGTGNGSGEVDEGGRDGGEIGGGETVGGGRDGSSSGETVGGGRGGAGTGDGDGGEIGEGGGGRGGEIDEGGGSGGEGGSGEIGESGGGRGGAELGGVWLGLAEARWWLGENQGSVEACTRAYALFRRAGDDGVAGAVRCAVWLAITYKANFANFPAAEGWLGRADRLLAGIPPGPPHGWVAIARSYRMDDLAAAAALTEEALALARAAADIDLELVALAQLGRVRVAQGDTTGGFALLDEALAGALGGEPASLDTVVYACCDMLNACDLATDVARAAQWCAVADGFVERYGCPFLYAECRTLYGGVLVAKGSWDAAERELVAALRITDGACPALHTLALVRLADLRLRQGRIEQAEQLVAELDARIGTEAETALTRAALLLARGDAEGASRVLAERLDRLAHHRLHAATALVTLVDAHLARGDLPAAHTAAASLTALATPVQAEDRLTGDDAPAPHSENARPPTLATEAASGDRVAVDDIPTAGSRAARLTTDTGPAANGDRVAGLGAGARGRVALAAGELEEAVVELEDAVAIWVRLELPYETGASLVDLARALAATHPDLAAEHGRRALAVFERLGAAEQADRVAALLRSLGVHARTGPKGVGLLTRREQEVLGLLGLGLSNPEIAGRLHVSRKTAAHHVSSILAKLQLRNRSEAAALATRANQDKAAGAIGS